MRTNLSHHFRQSQKPQNPLIYNQAKQYSYFFFFGSLNDNILFYGVSPFSLSEKLLYSTPKSTTKRVTRPWFYTIDFPLLVKSYRKERTGLDGVPTENITSGVLGRPVRSSLCQRCQGDLFYTLVQEVRTSVTRPILRSLFRILVIYPNYPPSLPLINLTNFQEDKTLIRQNYVNI